jgi:hypothetical protein
MKEPMLPDAIGLSNTKAPFQLLDAAARSVARGAQTNQRARDRGHDRPNELFNHPANARLAERTVRAWLIGVPWKDCPVIGEILGERIVLNEFVGNLNAPNT